MCFYHWSQAILLTARPDYDGIDSTLRASHGRALPPEDFTDHTVCSKFFGAVTE
jgi:hypothetical protein